ncbi:MAG: hypothetical protein H6620_05895 [Halobacteriovoraceae bacterium]|nr:hypothetical protein [Halobacteriovoraceae bacterium]
MKKTLYLILSLTTLNCFAGVHDCDLMEGDSRWQRVTVETNDEKIVSIELSNGHVGDIPLYLTCLGLHTEIYICQDDSLNTNVEISYDGDSLSLKDFGDEEQEEPGLYTCY